MREHPSIVSAGPFVTQKPSAPQCVDLVTVCGSLRPSTEGVAQVRPDVAQYLRTDEGLRMFGIPRAVKSSALVVALILSACQGSTTPTASSAPQKELRVAAASEVLSLDPMVDVSGHAQIMLQNIFDTLVNADNDYKQVGNLAESWKFIAPASWEFKLRQGVKFTSGDELTSEDVKYSYDRVLDPVNKSGMNGNFGQLSKVEAIDKYTVRFTTSSPDAIFPERTKIISIVPKKIVESYGLAKFAKEPVGSGPYKLVEWIKDDHLTLQANKDYFKGAPKIDKVTFKVIPEESTRIAALLSDQVDLVSGVSSQFVAQIKARPELKVNQIAGSRTNQVIMDTNVKPLDDVRVRRALSYAIDYDSLINNVMGGNAVRNGEPFGASIFGYDPNLKSKWYTFDLAKSKQLLTEAGYPNGFTVEFRGPNGATPNDKEVQQAIVGMLAKVGVTLNYQGMEFATWLTGYRARAWPMTWHTNADVILDADQVFGLFYLSTGRGYYKNPEMDKMVTASRAEMDPAKRLVLLQAIVAKAIDEAIWLNLFVQSDTWALKKNLNFATRSDEWIVMNTASWAQ